MMLENFKNSVLPLKNKLYRYAKSFLKDDEQAKDVVQDTFLKIWEKGEEATGYQNMEAWCMTVTRNLALDRLRQDQRHMNILNSEVRPFISHQSSYRFAEVEDDRAWIRQVLDGMPSKQAEVIRLRDMEGYSYREIGKVTGYRLSDIKVSIHRGRRCLKEKLNELYRYGLEKSRNAH